MTATETPAVATTDFGDSVNIECDDCANKVYAEPWHRYRSKDDPAASIWRWPDCVDGH